MKLIAPKKDSLLDLLRNAFAPATTTRIRKMIKNGMITVDGRRVTRPDFMVAAGQSIVYRKTAFEAVPPPVPIVYADHCIMVADKPPGLLTYGERGAAGTSLYQMLKRHLALQAREKPQLFVVHRLDREVSGLVLFARQQSIQEQLKSNWSKTRKLYYALIEGLCPEPRGTIRSWLTEGADRRMRSGEQAAQSKWAVTHFRVLQRLAAHTLMEIELETGRKNQIRVHLAEAGYPVVGDRRYGADAAVKRRIRLHAYSLALPHPGDGRPLHFELPMPDGFLTLEPRDENYK